MADKFQGADRNHDVSDFPLERFAGASEDIRNSAAHEAQKTLGPLATCVPWLACSWRMAHRLGAQVTRKHAIY
jgi:hypothetical protein